MASLGGRVPGAVQLPTIKLDTTLAELYRRARPDENAHARIGLVSCGISGGVDLTADFPRNAKFPYQDHALTRLPLRELRRGNVELQRSLAKKHLCLVTQRDAFISGNTPVVSFHLSRSPAHIEHARREAEATLAVLDPSQRPELVFCPGPADIPLAEHGIDRLEYKVVLDGLAAYPLTHDLETHWLLNSKAALARSGLPTPRADIIEPQGCPPPPGTCCPVCAASSSSPSSSLSSSYVPLIPARCTGARGAWLAAQTARILAAVRARPVPFAFKTQQAFGGAGTWLVATQAQKQRLLADLAPPPSYSSSSSSSSSSPPKADPPGQQQQEEEEEDDDDDDSPSVLRKLLSQVTRANAHLGPATVLLTELVRRRRRGPAAAAADSEEENHGLAFLVTSRGEAEFLAASEQMLADGHGGGSAWVGSVICYGRQDELRERFSGLMGRVARWVARRGYAGPVGVDVLLAGSSSGGGEGEGEGEQGLIVDLNVRTCGSLPLPLLRGHFVSRGLGCASNFSMTVGAGRAEFLERWRGPLEEGRMVILCWYEDPEARESIADVAVGGEDEARLGELMGRVREATEGVTF